MTDLAAVRLNMVESQVRTNDVTDVRIQDAMRALPRETFVPATKAYLALRRLLARRLGSLAPSVPPLEVARLFGQSAPQAREDASAVASLYCASAFGGRTLDLQAERELSERIKRLKKLA